MAAGVDPPLRGVERLGVEEDIVTGILKRLGPLS
jgi:hypothetical protein